MHLLMLQDQVVGQEVDQIQDRVVDQVQDQVLNLDRVVDQVQDQEVDQVVNLVVDQVVNQALDQVQDQVVDQVQDQEVDQAQDQVVDQEVDQVVDQEVDQEVDRVLVETILLVDQLLQLQVDKEHKEHKAYLKQVQDQIKLQQEQHWHNHLQLLNRVCWLSQQHHRDPTHLNPHHLQAMVHL